MDICRFEFGFWFYALICFQCASENRLGISNCIFSSLGYRPEITDLIFYFHILLASEAAWVLVALA